MCLMNTAESNIENKQCLKKRESAWWGVWRREEVKLNRMAVVNSDKQNDLTTIIISVYNVNRTCVAQPEAGYY